ncbi:MAG: hypothetical protein M3R60_01150, partial [Pseudomonadota bacterium]|nr:hypothetical protein [Pseudomonadota bacterium]
MPITILCWNPRLDLRAQALADYCLPRSGDKPPYPDGLTPHAVALVDRLLSGNVPLLSCRIADMEADAVSLPVAGGGADDCLLQLTPGILWQLSADELARHFAIQDTL